MQFLGFLLTVLYYRGDVEIDGISVETETVETLVNAIINSHEEPRFNLEDLEKSTFVRKGNIGKYFSNDLCDYVLYNNVTADTEAIIITIEFGENKAIQNDEINSDISEPIIMFVPSSQERVDTNPDLITATAENYLENFAAENNIPLDASSISDIIFLNNDHTEVEIETEDLEEVSENNPELNEELEEANTEALEEERMRRLFSLINKILRAEDAVK